jgi:hypothetical protein
MKEASAVWDRALAEAGWQVRPLAGRRTGYLVRKGARLHVAQVQRARESRQDLIRGHLADAVLQACRRAGEEKRARPLAIVVAPNLSERMRSQLREYMSDVAPDVAYGLVDDRGHAEFHRLQQQEIVTRLVPSSSTVVSAHSAGLLFSDLNQWLLKVLLGNFLPPALLHAPGGQPFRTVSALAQAAQVSLPSAARLAVALETEGFLEKSSGQLRLLRVPLLLERWKTEGLRRPVEVRARFALPSKDLDRQLAAAAAAASDAALGLFSAAAHLNARFVKGAPRHLYLRNVNPDSLQRVGLVPATDETPADVVVRKPTAPEALFRGRVNRDGISVTDVLQTWLDLSSHPARGSEQAAVLWRKYLAPALGER